MPLPSPERPDESLVRATSVKALDARAAFRMLAPPDLPVEDVGAPVMPLDAPDQARIIIVDAAGIAIEENVESAPFTDNEFRLIRNLDGSDEMQ